ncbi:molybdopterin/thiamine biosynthesis adenylyltransferase [Trinickia symbiotica]|uniref:THIF-type NAD/FAD binding fold domain-containing protein n=1 Tax=Trinickia symbiotica TaxID=863227 RepID=A0A2N7WKA4_9BURK|nr:ThiF family adenylyltransferase [Trinickia symbiotica]PMS29879.1 hypothetical protein C0Z20_30450 [Trinickia symbiotica]PPK41087.1 molybdopterin/thiamine biosynthesis adenylyltransferase [Trinickia symbiotica]
MDNLADRYHRNELLFGKEGQRKLGATSTVILGAGGLGSALAPHLALLGVRKITTVDDEELDTTNRNRFFGARDTDPVPGSAKVMIVDRLIRETNSQVESIPVLAHLVTADAFEAVRNADWIFGCFDEDGPRSILNELCAAYAKPYIDVASDVPTPGVYGGRVCVATGGGCLHCLGQLDPRDVRRFLEPEQQLEVEDRIYGVPKGALGEKGPSVAPINGVVASLAAAEFMAAVTGMRPSVRLLEYRGQEAKVLVSRDEPQEGCLVCKSNWGKGAAVDVERYLRIGHLAQRRHRP